MEPVDIILLIFLGIGTYRGFQTGLLMQLLGIIAFFLAIIGGFHLMYWGVDFLSERVEGYEAFLPITSFVVIFVIILVVINLIGKGLKSILDMTILGSLDNVTGALAGLLKWALVLSILIWMASAFTPYTLDEYYENTAVFPVIASIAPYLFDTLSGVLPYLEEFSRETNELPQALLMRINQKNTQVLEIFSIIRLG